MDNKIINSIKKYTEEIGMDVNNKAVKKYRHEIYLDGSLLGINIVPYLIFLNSLPISNTSNLPSLLVLDGVSLEILSTVGDVDIFYTDINRVLSKIDKCIYNGYPLYAYVDILNSLSKKERSSLYSITINILTDMFNNGYSYSIGIGI